MRLRNDETLATQKCQEGLLVSLNDRLFKGKLHSEIISSDMIFSVESDGEGPRSKFEREDGQTDGGRTGTWDHL